MDMVVVGVGVAMACDPGPNPSFSAKVFVVPPSEVGVAKTVWCLAGAKGLVPVVVCFVFIINSRKFISCMC